MMVEEARAEFADRPFSVSKDHEELELVIPDESQRSITCSFPPFV